MIPKRASGLFEICGPPQIRMGQHIYSLIRGMGREIAMVIIDIYGFAGIETIAQGIEDRLPFLSMIHSCPAIIIGQVDSRNQAGLQPSSPGHGTYLRGPGGSGIQIVDRG